VGQVGGCRPLAGHGRGRSWAVGERRPATGGRRAEAVSGFCWRPTPTGSRWLASNADKQAGAWGRATAGWRRAEAAGAVRRAAEAEAPGDRQLQRRPPMPANPSASFFFTSQEFFAPIDQNYTGPRADSGDWLVPSAQRLATTLTACSNVILRKEQ
jgi:hypothetical protein